MEKLLENTLLYDFYGDLLTCRRKDIYHMYFFEDMSLAEIGERLGITRQAVNFSLKQSQQSIEGFEAILGLVALHRTAKAHLVALNRALAAQDLDESNRILLELEKIL
ncbi:MAG: DNA-binding protein [Clostridiales bacterium]|nr:DNA-binding protein [Clostridiales bacterium]